MTPAFTSKSKVEIFDTSKDDLVPGKPWCLCIDGCLIGYYTSEVKAQRDAKYLCTGK